MTDSQKRQYVSNLYDGPKWKKRVEKMSDDQITAIYLKTQRDEHVPEDTHSELDGFAEAIEPNATLPVVDISVAMHPPHSNEDDFPIY